jgi:hypothetical protein
MKKLIILLAVLLGLSGCSEERFQPIKDHPELALDTKTGQVCYTLPPPQHTYTDSRGVEYNQDKPPFCRELAAR